jgi:hypothetical protein
MSRNPLKDNKTSLHDLIFSENYVKIYKNARRVRDEPTGIGSDVP